MRFIVLLGIVCGVIGWFIGRRRHREISLAVAGFLLGPIGLILGYFIFSPGAATSTPPDSIGNPPEPEWRAPHLDAPD